MKKILSCIILLLISVSSADAGIEVPSKENLVGAPKIKGKKGNYYAVFDYGGLKFKYEIIKLPVPYPQCDALTSIDEGIIVIGSNPAGYIYFVQPRPFAFKTAHNPIWQRIIRGVRYGRP